MITHELVSKPPPDLACALQTFEQGFTYPLGPLRRFRITHGEDYGFFFKTIGRSAVFVAEERGQVLGTLAMALRTLWMPDGTEQTTAYIGDLKISPSSRGGWALARLAKAALSWSQGKTTRAFSIVMQGTSSVPVSYTGRVGIPLFKELARVTLLRMSEIERMASISYDRFAAAPKVGLTCYRNLTHGRFAVPASQSTRRSAKEPQWLVSPDGSACGLLEDTRLAKRLWLENGEELVSAHLSCFAFSSPDKGIGLLKAALSRCHHQGDSALFAAASGKDAQALRRALVDVQVEEAPVLIYGTGLPDAFEWNINTSEV